MHVERSLPDTVDFLQELVRIPSLLGNEEPTQRLVESRLRDLGFDARTVEPNPLRGPSLPRGNPRGRRRTAGACDMTGGIAAMLLGVEATLAAGPLPGPVVYQSVIEEECGENGALSACATVLALPLHRWGESA